MHQAHLIDLHFYDQEEVIAAFLVETEEGPILIETGPFSTFEKLKEGVSKAGYRVEDIKHVFLSHIHLDHAGAAWWFARNGAKIYVHPLGFRHLHDPSKLMNSAKRIYMDMMDTLWGRMEAIPENLLHQVGHEEEINIGNKRIKSWHTPGHAVHHIAWQIGDILFAGDVAGVKIGDGPVVPPCPPPDINIEDWQNSINLIRKISPSCIYLTHYGQVTDINSHLTELETELLYWANWIKPYFEKGTAIPHITPLFQEMVQERLSSKGVVEDIHKGQYEAANPSWMSVSGLLRYWKKRHN